MFRHSTTNKEADCVHNTTKPLEDKPAAFSQKSIMANANAAALAVHRERDQRPFFLMDVNGEEASLLWINRFCKKTAYHLMNRQVI